MALEGFRTDENSGGKTEKIKREKRKKTKKKDRNEKVWNVKK
jgi:hypothetical protein